MELPFRQQLVSGMYKLKRGLRRTRRARGRQQARGPLVDGRVVVAMDAGIGNAVEATPLVQAVRALWPRARITLIAPKGDLLDGWCVPDRIVHSWDEVSGEDVDRTFLAWFTEAPEGVPGEIHRAQRAFPDYLLRPEREVNLDLARALGYAGLAPPLYVSMRRPKEPPPGAAQRVSIVAGSKTSHRWRNKRWPHYRELAERLLERDTQVCVLGRGDQDFPGDVPDGATDLRGTLSLAETAWVLRHSDLCIGNDCGPMHVADAVLAPALVLFGPSCEIKNGPRNRGVPLSIDVECSPCQYDLELLDSCDNPLCMNELSVDLVLERARRMLAEVR